MKTNFWSKRHSVLSGLLLAISFAAPAAISPQQGVFPEAQERQATLGSQQLKQALASRCTPGFVCGHNRVASRPRVSHDQAVRFAVLMGIAR